jgi:uncharacterized membrane protein YidH (DUF202 family)
VAVAVALCAFAVGIEPLVYWLRHGELREPMIYRVLMASLLTTVTAVVLCAAVVADHIAATAHYRPRTASGAIGWLARTVFSRRGRLLGGATLLAVAVAVVWPGLVQYATSGEVTMHWSRAAFSSLLVVLAAILGVTTFLLNMLGLIQAQRENAPRVRPPERIHAARRS